MIKVLLAEDHELVRAGIKRLLEESGDIHVVAEATNGMEAVQEYSQHRPDIVMLDISMPIMDGIDACKQIVGSDPGARILILTIHPEEQYTARLLKAGASGYITKGSHTADLLQAVHTVAEGKKFLSEKGQESVLYNILDAKKSNESLEALSDRELQVLCLIARGNKTGKIAESLGLSVKTIETYRSRILSKLNTKSNAELALFAYQNNLL